MRSNAESRQLEAHHVTVTSPCFGEQDKMVSVVETYLPSFDFKVDLCWLSQNELYHAKSRTDTESCHRFFCLKLVIFNGAK